MTPEEQAFIEQMMGIGPGSSQPFSMYPEYSASKGRYMPVDSGSMATNFNVLQDMNATLQNPLVLALLGMTGGEQFGMVQEEGSTDGRDTLQQILETSAAGGGESPEGFMAGLVLQGKTPTEVVRETDVWLDTVVSTANRRNVSRRDVLFPDMKSDEIVDFLRDTATDYFDMVMKDRPAVEGEGLTALRSLGLPDPQEEYALAEFNPEIVPANDRLNAAKDARDAAKEEYGSFGKRPFKGPLANILGVDNFRMGSFPDVMGYEQPKHDSAKYKAMMDTLPELASARSNAQYQAGYGLARQNAAKQAGVNPLQDAVRSLFNRLQSGVSGTGQI